MQYQWQSFEDKHLAQPDELVNRRVWVEALRKYAAIRCFTDDGQMVLEFSPDAPRSPYEMYVDADLLGVSVVLV